ncbi:hypothetical protein ASPZODRAFT_130785 [Penicilliopsis zonata CBS 506.65]|uniref:Uncharacterized protein n=1 Tax=Penicilliopsis zonata CBS 506.65 TaxID=1073090 RepID=A0A1L9SNB0_9EURO|nr:hypothetical protein ASPZODRAFT_130785 [Penicilliopsis zonata CBS 506.65]OJJ48678.1 hypothetical protein ASPZODRAFT_130785 [Penicilliopsis zonata CBS 506.65]
MPINKIALSSEEATQYLRSTPYSVLLFLLRSDPSSSVSVRLQRGRTKDFPSLPLLCLDARAKRHVNHPVSCQSVAVAVAVAVAVME